MASIKCAERLTERAEMTLENIRIQDIKREKEKDIQILINKTFKFNGLIVINIYDNNKRKFMHEFLEGFAFKTSMKCNSLKSDTRYHHNIKLCHECDNKIPLSRFTYEHGIMDNNMDERYSTICDKCSEHIWIEPHIDGEDFMSLSYPANNVIVVGNSLHHWSSPRASRKNKLFIEYDKYDMQKYNDIIKESKIYHLDNVILQPKQFLSKKCCMNI
jgi:hypothetical protein